MPSDQSDSVRVTFDYYPDEPDPADHSGMSEDEFLRLHNALAELGADNVKIESRRS